MTRKKIIKDNPNEIAQPNIDCPTVISDKSSPTEISNESYPIEKSATKSDASDIKNKYYF